MLLLGPDAKLYFCAAGIGGTPSWTELDTVTSVNVRAEDGETDSTTRASAKYKRTEPVLRDLSFEIVMPKDPSDAHYVSLLDAYVARSKIGIAAMDADIATAGSEGWWADVKILTMSQSEPIDGKVEVTFTAKPTATGENPQWKTVTT